MPESVFNREQQVNGPEYEAELLVWLNEAIKEVNWWSDKHGYGLPPDVAPDVLASYCKTVAERDSEFGRLLVRKLVERSLDVGPYGPNEHGADQHRELAKSINQKMTEAGHVEPGWLARERMQEGTPFPNLDVTD